MTLNLVNNFWQPWSQKLVGSGYHFLTFNLHVFDPDPNALLEAFFFRFSLQ